MDMVWLLSLLILSIDGISEGASTPDAVKVGALLSLSSVNGKVSKIAIEAAEEDVNSDPSVLGGRKLSISLHDSNYSGFLGLTGAMKYMVSETVAIIGPQDATMAHILSHLSNELHVPLLSFTALDPTLSALQYPYFIQTAPNDQFQMAAIADMISYYGWHGIVIIFTDDDQSRNGMVALGDKMEEKGLKISSKVALPPSYPGATKAEVHRALVSIKMMESRIIVLYTFSKTGFLVFEVAQSLGMMESGYVWIASSWLSTVIDSTLPLPSKIANSLQGVLTLRLHTPDSKTKQSFISRWGKLSNGSIGLNTYGLYAYDTVWMIARGVKELFDQNGTISFSKNPRVSGLNRENFDFSSLHIFDQGKQLLNNLWNINMTGLTGPIQFPNRTPLHPSYEILNFVKSGMKRIGYWSDYSGLSVVLPETLYGRPANRSTSNQQLSSRTVWPGGSTIKPRGWVIPLDGRRLRIGVPRRVSYQEFVTPGNGSDTVHGYCIDVFTAAISLLPYEVNYEFILFGNGEENPNYFELVNNVATKEFDAAVGDIAIVTNRTRIVDFTQPYIDSGLVVLAPVDKLNSSPLAFFRPFSPMLWIVTAASFLLVGVVVWILEHQTNEEFQGHPRTQIVTILWFGFSTMFFAHRENVASTTGRFVVIVWLFVVLIINSSYTASLTSIFTVQQLSSPITGIDSLTSSNKPIGFQVGSFAESYLNEQLNIQKSRLIALGSPEEYAAAIENGTVAAIVDEQPYIDLFLTQYCDYSITGPQFTKSGWGFAFPRDSPLANDISSAILSLSESGDLQKIYDKWFSRKSCSYGDSDKELEQLHLQSFLGLFFICGGICIFALTLYFCFTMHQFHKDPEKDNDTSSIGKCNRECIRNFLKFADRKRDPKIGSGSKRKLEDSISKKPEEV